MKILITGAGKMGTFLTDVLCIQHEVALYDTDPKKLRFVFNTLRLTQLDEIRKTALFLISHRLKPVCRSTMKNVEDAMYPHTPCSDLLLPRSII